MKQTIVKLLGSLVFLAIIFYQVEWSSVIDHLKTILWWTIPFALIFQVAQIVISAYRWLLILKSQGTDISFFALLRIFWSASFLNNFLPSTVGGDVFRAYHLYKSDHGSSKSISPILTERAVGLVSLLILASIALLFMEIPLGILEPAKFVVLLGLFTSTVLLLLISYRPLFVTVYRWLLKLRNIKFARSILKIISAFHRHLNDPHLVLKILLISIVAQLFVILSFFTLNIGLGGNSSFPIFLFVIPLVAFIASIPISLGGLGLREASLIALLYALGMDKSLATAISLLYIPVLYLSCTPGLAFLMGDHSSFSTKKNTSCD